MLAIIDGDILCYFACKPRWQSKVDIKDGVNYFNIDANGKKVPLDYTRDEDIEYVDQTWKVWLDIFNSILESTYATDFVMGIKGEGNYRSVIYPDYKVHRNRKPDESNKFVPLLRKFAVAEDYAIPAHDREADDLIRIWAEESRYANKDFIICSVDKDLKCIPGKHFNMKTSVIEEVSEFQAMYNYYFQLIKGDQTDNIPGVPGVGEVKTTKCLLGCTTESDFQEAVVETYISNVGDSWKEWLLFNGKLIHIQRHFNDYFTLKDWKIVKELDEI
jgi:5'-3' exonuclease